MDANSKYEFYSIINELQSIIKELNDAAYGISKDFTNIGNDKCASCVSTVSIKYRTIKRNLEDIDTSKATTEIVASSTSVYSKAY